MVTEIYAGARKREIPSIERLLNNFKYVEINSEIGKLAGKFLNKYRKSHNVELADSLIASCSLFTALNSGHLIKNIIQ